MKVIQADTRLQAWLMAAEYLVDIDSELNLSLSIKSPGSDGPKAHEAYRCFDDFFSSEKTYPLHTVAETIFSAIINNMIRQHSWSERFRKYRPITSAPVASNHPLPPTRMKNQWILNS